MSSGDPEIRCMLIPLREGRLLLPSAAVAEVIGYRTPDPVPGQASWLQGQVNWHQRDIPVVDFERLLGREQAGAGIRQRIVVCYAPDSDPQWPLIGLVAQGIPRLLRVGAGSIGYASGDPAGSKPVQLTLTIDREDLLVPDLDYIKAQLAA